VAGRKGRSRIAQARRGKRAREVAGFTAGQLFSRAPDDDPMLIDKVLI
jgi:hypothetical protein